MISPPRRARALAWPLAALLLAALLLAPAAARTAAEPRVTVQAQPRFEVLERRRLDPNRVELRARLVDDVGAPMPGTAVEIVRSELEPEAHVTGCTEAPHRVRRSSPLESDSAGELCLRVSAKAAVGSVVLGFRGDGLHLPIQQALSLGAPPPELRLVFEAPSLELSLDEPQHRLELRVSGDAGSEPLPALSVQLQDASGPRPLRALEWLRSGPILSFRLGSEELGEPGPARLVVHPATASSASSPPLAEAVALRTASVQLRAEVLAADAETAQVRVRAHSRVGPPTSGWVEAGGGAEQLASSPLFGGAVDLQVALPRSTPQRLTLRYHADDPWWRPGEPVELELGGPAPGDAARWPWLVILAPIGYVCLRALERPAARRPRRRPSVAAAPVLAAAAPPLGAPIAGWHGTIIDAHDGRSIRGARVELALPSLRTEGRRVQTFSDATGSFVLPPLPEPIPEGARLIVSAPFHAEVQRTLPPQGRVVVSMTTRRRALLNRFVRWARSAGPGWQRTGEPTPGEIADVALRRGDLETARWAEAIQAAAFDQGEVDHAREAELRAREPSWLGTAERTRRNPDED